VEAVVSPSLDGRLSFVLSGRVARLNRDASFDPKAALLDGNEHDAS